MAEPTEPNTCVQRAVAVAIVVVDGRVLLVRRRVPEGRLWWQFPAGAVEPGETSEEAAVRETREEVGLAVRAIRTLGERAHPETGRHVVYVACAVIGGQPSRCSATSTPRSIEALSFAAPLGYVSVDG